MRKTLGRGPVLLPYQKRWIEDRSQLKIWLASRQVGKSFALALEAVFDAASSKCLNVMLSSSERQSLELMRKVHLHITALSRLTHGRIASAGLYQRETRLQNGSRIIALAANASTARGFSGNVYLDEFAFHHDSREVWRALYPTITRGFKIRVSSTPNGRASLFHELWTSAESFSRHRTDIHEAAAQGLKVDIDSLRSGLGDPEAWAQEYECRFLDESSALLPLGLISRAESEDAPLVFNPSSLSPKTERYIGVDVGRSRDLTVFWILERTGDVLWTRGIQTMRGETYSIQREALYTLITAIKPRRCVIDATGIGGQFAEEARERFGQMIEQAVFTPALKEDAALGLRRALEDRTLRIPQSTELRSELHSVRRSVTSSGNVRLSAERTSDGHADRFWALALAVHGASQSRVRGEMSYESISTSRFSPASRRGRI